MSANSKKLYKSRSNRIFMGVCGGIGEYLGVDPTVVRLLWAVLICCAGTGLLAYIVMGLIMSEMPDGTSYIETEHTVRRLRKSFEDRRLLGVCGGIAEYLGVSATVVRIIWAAAVLLFGAGILAYIVCAIIIPS